MAHWLDKIVEIMEAETADLRDLARIAGYDPADFYRGTVMDGADLRGQDLTGMEFTRLDLSKVKYDSNTRLSSRLMLDQARIFRDFDTAPEMIVVPPGEFMMGSPDGEGSQSERPQHKVTIGYAFAVSIAPVTLGEFAAFVPATNHGTGSDADAASWRDPGFRQDDDHPVVRVNWHDAQAYVAWLKERSGRSYRLLSEAEWEYCCRAGTTSAYSTGDSITPDQANFYPNHQGTTSVFKFPPNAFGLRDMHGNVWEWCADNWHDDYTGTPPMDGSVWAGGDESLRVLRGGSWYFDPLCLRSAYRSHNLSGYRFLDFGFRVARTL